MTIVVRCSMGQLRCGRRMPLHHLDADVGRVGDDVEHRRPLLRLRDDRLDVLLGRIRVDVEGHLDVVVAVAHVAVDAENALDVHGPLDFRFDRPELNTTILCDRGDAGGQAAGQTDEHVFDRRGTEILGGKDLRMVRFERELGLVLLLFAESVKALDLRVGVGAVLPLAGCPPFEFRCLRRGLQCFPRGQQCPYVDAVVDTQLSHGEILPGTINDGVEPRCGSFESYISGDMICAYDAPSAEARRGLGRYGRYTVPRPSTAACARLWTPVAPSPYCV